MGRACAKMLKEERRKVPSGGLEEQERSLKELFSMWLPDPRCLQPEWLVPALGLSGRNEADWPCSLQHSTHPVCPHETIF